MRPALKTLIPALAVSLLLAACGSSSSTTTSSTTSSAAQPSTASQTSTAAPSAAASGAVKTASNATLGKTVLVSAQGMTLYRLTGESNGKFICNNAACEAHWPPVSASATSASISGLGTVKRPNGMEQLTYKGAPLYTFVGDTAPGKANGQGLKDVGTWMAVPTSAAASSSSTAPASASSAAGASNESSSSSSSSSSGGSSGGGGGYAY